MNLSRRTCSCVDDSSMDSQCSRSSRSDFLEICVGVYYHLLLYARPRTSAEAALRLGAQDQLTSFGRIVGRWR